MRFWSRTWLVVACAALAALVPLGEPPTQAADSFTDVAAGHTFHDDIGWLADNGITKGCNPPDNTRFCPDDQVTRGQMAAFLHRAIDHLLGTGPNPGGAESDVSPGATGESLAAAGGGENTNQEPSGANVNPGGAAPRADSPAVGPARGGHRPPIPEVGEVLATAEEDSPSLRLQAIPGETPYYSGERVLGITSEWYSTYDNLPPQVGRVFMWNLVGGTYLYGGSCSGTIVGRDMVLTAGHCILQANGDYLDAFTFYPDLYGAQAAYGYWTTTEAWIPTLYETYRLSGSENQQVFDYGILKMDPNGAGQYPGDVITPFPVLMNTAGLGLATYAMGYPVEGWFSSQGYCLGGGLLSCFPWYCSSSDTTSVHWGNGWYTLGYGCDASGGISGGPVFAVYNSQWYVISVNSHGSVYYQEPCYSLQISMRYCAADYTYGRNLWGPEFRGGDGGIYGFDAFWNAVANL